MFHQTPGAGWEVPRILSEAHPFARKTLPRIPSCGYKLVHPGPSEIKKNSIVWGLADRALRLASGARLISLVEMFLCCITFPAGDGESHDSHY